MENVNAKEEIIIQDTVHKLNSSAGVRLNGRIKTTATLKQDRVEFDIWTKKFNKIPVIIYEDILKVEIGIKLSYYYCFLTIVALIGTFANPLVFVLAVLFAFAAVNRKVIISLRSGHQLIVYSLKKEAAQDFVKELKERVNRTGGIQI